MCAASLAFWTAIVSILGLRQDNACKPSTRLEELAGERLQQMEQVMGATSHRITHDLHSTTLAELQAASSAQTHGRMHITPCTHGPIHQLNYFGLHNDTADCPSEALDSDFEPHHFDGAETQCWYCGQSDCGSDCQQLPQDSGTDLLDSW
mmetsp:Transcript_18273/g.33115  ORF Transcript_18273/g.33115 Transcript_18273/m.33115 type:complete len:150 (-) Transcript_18273:5-454(-)